MAASPAVASATFDPLAGLNGLTLRQFLGLVDTLLGGGANGFAIDQLAPIATEINAAFTQGAPSAFAQEHLVSGACP